MSLLIFSFSIHVCKKACHLLLDQPLLMALPLLLSLLLLLLPPLPPSLRPSTQVFAWFSSAKPSIFRHRPRSLLSAACTTSQLYEGLVPPAQRWLLCLHSQQSSTSSSSRLTLSGLSSALTVCAPNYQTICNAKLQTIYLQGERSLTRLLGRLFVNTATIRPVCCTSPANHPAAHAKLRLSQDAFIISILP